MARDLLLHDPPRVLAWRLLHDPRLAEAPRWLAPLLPHPAEGLDRDPVALLLGAVAAGCAILYLIAALRGARPVARGVLVGVAAAATVVVPTLAFVAMGAVTGRPYGQDGGVVQLPLALDKILSGSSPYGADYSDSILGKEARVSDFWAPYGGNPILHHHAYLPGTHLQMMPFYLACRGLLGVFDPRFVTLVSWGLGVLLASRIAREPGRRLVAVTVSAVNPLVYWHQVFGANDALVVALLLASVLLAERSRPMAAAASLGLACATKQLAWPFAPFLLVQLAGLGSFRDLASREGLRRLARPALVTAGVFLAVVAPVAALDWRSFWGDIVVYNVGLPGADNYPLGGTPGFGFANFLICFGAVSSLKDYFPFGWFYALLLPVGLLLLGRQLRDNRPSTALVTGSAALLASVYFSRVVHPNYLILAAVLLPVGVLMDERLRADVAVVPLLLLAVAVEVAEHEVLRGVWEDALASRVPQHLTGLWAALAPAAGPGLSRDPLGLLLSAAAAGLGVAYLIAAVLGAGVRWRATIVGAAVVVVVVVPTVAVAGIGAATGRLRTQDPWLCGVATAVDEARQAGFARQGIEAWSTSFRRDPPAGLACDAERVAPGGVALGGLLGRAGFSDPRPAFLVAIAGTGLLLARLTGPEAWPLAAGVALLSPMAVVGIAFGSSDPLLLALVLATWVLARDGRPLAAGVALGFGITIAPRALLLLPLVLVGGGRRTLRALLGVLSGALLPALVVGSAGLRAFWTAGAPPGLAPGLGLSNLLAYGSGVGVTALVAVLALGALALLGLALEGAAEGSQPAAWAAALLLLGLYLWPGSSPEETLVPLVLVLLLALTPPGMGARRSSVEAS